VPKKLAKEHLRKNLAWNCSMHDGITCETPEVSKKILVHSPHEIGPKEKKRAKSTKTVEANPKSVDIIPDAGGAWVGKRAKCYWSHSTTKKTGKGNWYYGTITEYDQENDKYAITYDEDTGCPTPVAWHNYDEFTIVRNEYGAEQEDDTPQIRSERTTRRLERDARRTQDLIVAEEKRMMSSISKKRKAGPSTSAKSEKPSKRRKLANRHPSRQPVPEEEEEEVVDADIDLTDANPVHNLDEHAVSFSSPVLAHAALVQNGITIDFNQPPPVVTDLTLDGVGKASDLITLTCIKLENLLQVLKPSGSDELRSANAILESPATKAAMKSVVGDLKHLLSLDNSYIILEKQT